MRSEKGLPVHRANDLAYNATGYRVPAVDQTPSLVSHKERAEIEPMDEKSARSFYISYKDGLFKAYAYSESRDTYTLRDVDSGLEELLRKCKVPDSIIWRGCLTRPLTSFMTG